MYIYKYMFIYLFSCEIKQKMQNQKMGPARPILILHFLFYFIYLFCIFSRCIYFHSYKKSIQMS